MIFNYGGFDVAINRNKIHALAAQPLPTPQLKPRTRKHPSSYSPAIAQTPNHSKAIAHFCQREQRDRSIPQAIAQLGLSDGEGDRA